MTEIRKQLEEIKKNKELLNSPALADIYAVNWLITQLEAEMKKNEIDRERFRTGVNELKAELKQAKRTIKVEPCPLCAMNEEVKQSLKAENEKLRELNKTYQARIDDFNERVANMRERIKELENGQ